MPVAGRERAVASVRQAVPYLGAKLEADVGELRSPRVVFFDIDGTLIDTAGAGRAAMLRALREFYGIAPRELQVDFAGRTDRAIARDLLAAHGIAPEDETLDRFLQGYVQFLPEELAKRPEGRRLPGVPDVLDWLGGTPGIEIGLLTGNVREGAFRKLAHFGLDHYFSFGGFGDACLDRGEVARAAIQAAGEALGEPVDPARCLVVGDTVHDVSCARAIGARAIAVLTGWNSHEALAEAGPDAILRSLEELAGVLKS